MSVNEILQTRFLLMTSSIAEITPLSETDPESQTILALQNCPEIFAAIGKASETGLKLQTSLRESFSPELVRAALGLWELRLRAKRKFTLGDQMWFDRKGFEQSTPELVARHKAARFHGAPGFVYDLCSGIGSDSIALAAENGNVVSVDLLPAAGLRTDLNAQLYQVGERIQTWAIDVRTVGQGEHWVHIDPDRRTNQNRAVRLEDYEPALDFLQELTETAPAGALKLSPASNFGGKFRDCEIELISLYGECKEATVWFGELAGEYDWRATLLPSGATLSANPWEHYPRVRSIQEFIYDPDPAVVRAGLIDALVDQLDLARLDDAEEYLTSEVMVDSPFITPFLVLAELPNNSKEIRNYFRKHPVGEVEIKCRHVPTNAEQMRKKLSLNGTGKLTLFIARLQGKTRAIIAKRLGPSAQ